MQTLAVTVKGGSPFAASGYTTLSKSALVRRAALFLSRRGIQDFRELGITLNGVVAGSTAAESYTEIKAEDDPADYGGQETIVTVSQINRATAAADQTLLNSILFAYSKMLASWPKNGDGNPRGLPGGTPS